MNEVEVFNFETNEVRTVIINNEPWFVGKDVADILGYSDTQAMTRRLDDEDKETYTDKTSGQGRNVAIINESGLYTAILGSKKPEAKQFKRWVTSEVLPAIRKHGAYMTDKTIEDVLTDPDTLIRLATDLKNERQAKLALKQENSVLLQQNNEMKPKALFADAVATSHTSVLVGELAKILKQNGVDTGATRLFVWLRNNGYLISRKGTDYNMPTQKSMNLRLFEIKETSIARSNGSVSVSKTPKVTGRGQQYFVNKFLTEKINMN